MRRFLLPLVIVLALFPLAFAQLYTRTFVSTRTGKSLGAQRATLRGVPWFKPEYRALVKRLKAHLDPSDSVFIEPSSLAPDERFPGGRTRWFLYLANDLYPLRVYVREPKWASGTLVDYPRWLDLHFEELDVDGSGLGLGAVLRREKLKKKYSTATDELELDWKLTYPVSERFRIADVRFFARDPEVDGGWRELDLPDFLDGGAGELAEGTE
jgi:hypothetical protein